MYQSKKKKTWIILSIVLAIMIGLNGGLLYFGRVLDVYVGMGEMVKEELPGAENWDDVYYETDYDTSEAIDKYAKSVTQSIAEEGIVMLKNNNNALPLKVNDNKNISLFGRRSVDFIFGGTGSGSGDTSQSIPLAEALEGVGYSVNPQLIDFYKNHLESVPVSENTIDNLSKMTYYIGEIPVELMDQTVTSSYSDYNDAAIVVIGRQGGEGIDFSTDLKKSIADGNTGMSSDVEETSHYQEGQHQLELSYEETQMIQHVEENFDKVIVLINSANVMEVDSLKKDDQIDSILWVSYTGSVGTIGLANILDGQVTPSGHTVDTWPVDLTNDPTFNNTISEAYNNIDDSNALGKSYVLEYEEGIYVGYRYYETQYAESNQFKVDGAIVDYDEAVSYPFGYGLSYASFDQKITGHSVDEDGVITVDVEVTNTQPETGYSGKDVIQLYYEAPYNGDIEKSAIELAAFEKTDELQPGESKVYQLSFNQEAMSSFDYKNHQAYVLDAGDYNISIRKNSHEAYEHDDTSFAYNVGDTVVFDQTHPRMTDQEAQIGEYVNLETKEASNVKAATNRFDGLSEHFAEFTNAEKGQAVNFTRDNFEASFPTQPTELDLEATSEEIEGMGDYTPDYYDANAVMPITKANNNIQAVALRGLSYDDPLWDKLLDQLKAREMESFIYSGNQGTSAITSIGLPATTATDGPAGLKQYGGLGFSSSGNFNCSSTLLAATWNIDLAEEFGKSVGNEAVSASKSGWYAPGANIHRSAFGGRNFEYYSEDPFISGMMSAYTIQGVASKGVATYMKHFVANDNETHRIDNGYVVWVNEQALREIYLKPFEIAVKKPIMALSYLDENGVTHDTTIRATTGIMSSFNRLGTTWTGASDPLLNQVLRGEWGFIGTVITDYNSNQYQHVEEGVVNGNDLMLANASTLPSRFADIKQPSTVIAMRQAMKNCIYTIVNSNAVNGQSASVVISYKISPWKIWLIIFDVAVLVVIALILLLTSRRKRKA